jgi:hypothetical protein
MTHLAGPFNGHFRTVAGLAGEREAVDTSKISDRISEKRLI